MKHPVFIHMPTYNGANYIDEAISSLLAQDYPYFILNISDDASTDDTVARASRWALSDSRITISSLDRNRGAWHNWAIGLEQAHSYTYFMWACQDDIWSSDWISQCVAALESDRYVAACGRVLTIDRSGERVTTNPSGSKSHRYMSSRSRAIRLARYALESEEFGKNNNIFAVFRTESLLACNLWPKNYMPSPACDYQIVRRVLNIGSIKSISRPHLFKRIGSSTHTFSSDTPGFAAKKQVVDSFPLAILLRTILASERSWADLYKSDSVPIGNLERGMLFLKAIFNAARHTRTLLKRATSSNK